jgi:hypothetical protein
MKVYFGTDWLAAGGYESTSGFSLEGTQVNESVFFAGAADAAFFARGNRSQSYGFGVLRSFNSPALCERFILTHFADLPTQDDLHFLSQDGTLTETVTDAVIDGVRFATPRGVSVFVHYLLRGPIATVDGSPWTPGS